MIPMAIKPRLNPPHVVAGDAPGGVPQIVGTQLLIFGVLVATYIGLWMVYDDSARLPGTLVQPPHQIAMPQGMYHEVHWTKELTDIRAAEVAKLTQGGPIAGASDAQAFRVPIDQAMVLLVQRGLPTKVMPEAMAQIELAKASTEANGGQTEWLSGDLNPNDGAVSAKAAAATASNATAAAAPAKATETTHAAPAGASATEAKPQAAHH